MTKNTDPDQKVIDHFNLGNVYQENGDFEQAIGAYKRSLALKPDYVEALNNLANVLKKQGKFKSFHCNLE